MSCFNAEAAAPCIGAEVVCVACFASVAEPIGIMEQAMTADSRVNFFILFSC